MTLHPSDATSVPVCVEPELLARAGGAERSDRAVGRPGAIRIFNQAGQTHVLVDVAGYYRGHTHDDRYHLKAEAQARTAANSLTCPAGQLLRAVAANGAPTCASTAPTVTNIAGPINVVPVNATFTFAATRASITTTACRPPRGRW